jgi:hypothetical protein
VEVLVETVNAGSGRQWQVVGRGAHQAPETDGQVVLTLPAPVASGELVNAKVVATDGVDLLAEPLAGACTGVAG